MKKKEEIKLRYSVRGDNPSREDRLKALLEGKVILISTNMPMYYKLDKYLRLTFSRTGHESSFHPYQDGFNYRHVLDDYDQPSGWIKRIKII